MGEYVNLFILVGQEPSLNSKNIAKNIAKNNILVTYFSPKDIPGGDGDKEKEKKEEEKKEEEKKEEEEKNDPFVQGIKLDCTKQSLGRFRSSKDSNYQCVKTTIAKCITFATTRRLWYEISSQKYPGDLEEIQRQILKGADIDRKDWQGKSALHLAIEAKSPEKVRLLLENDANVNSKDDTGILPIIKAIKGNDINIVRALMERGAILDKESKAALRGDLQMDSAIKDLSDNPRSLAGPSIQNDNGKWFGNPNQDSIPDDCRSAMSLFNATVTTFELTMRGNDSGSSTGENEIEYRTPETIPVSELLYGEQGDSLMNDKLGPKKWRWYHLPVNNVSYNDQLMDLGY